MAKNKRTLPAGKPVPWKATAPATLQPFVRRTTPDYITDEVQPEVAIERLCMRKGKDTLRPCHIELTLVGEKLAKRHKVAPGSYLRACIAPKKPGVLIPVKDHTEALEKSRKYCACREGGEDAQQCATQIGGGRHGLGRHGRRSRRKP